MNKVITYALIFAFFTIFSLSSFDILIQDAEAIKAKGFNLSPKSFGSATKNIVCGDRLCSEISVQPEISFSRSIGGLDTAKPSETVKLRNGDFFELEAKPVVKKINDDLIRMYGYNGQIPGPLLKVKQGSDVKIDFTDNIGLETTVHWHGLRLNDNGSDGFPYINQDPIKPGESFLYNINFPDPGVYIYHSHFRGDLEMELGLYGNIIVEPSSKIYNFVDKEIPIILDDIKIENGDVAEFSKDYSNHSLMGRFGNTMFVNGETNFSFDVEQGEIVRFYLTSTANSRTFNFLIEDHQLKLVAGDESKYENEFFADSIIISSSERQIVEVFFDKSGTFSLLHETPEKKYTLGTVNVSPKSFDEKPDYFKLNQNPEIIGEISRYEKYFLNEPDFELELDLNSDMMMDSMKNDHHMDMAHTTEPIEWEDNMPAMNEMSNSKNTEWILRDKATGKEGFDINYQFKVGDVKKFRIFNDPNSVHPMQHPIHFHGQRFLVLSVDGVPTDNFVWKDTVLVPTGSTVDILIDFTNSGTWVAHCHILEHEQAGMITSFTVL